MTLPLPKIVAQLNALQTPVLFGYPTVLARLAAEQRAGRLRIAPVAVTCTSETCTPELRAAITDGFHVPLIDGFGSTEGLAGSSNPGEEAIVFAEDGCIVELVDDDNRPVFPGIPSAKILITNLDNRLQPLIRYEITNRLIAEPPAAEHGYLRARVQGRADEMFHYGPVTVHPFVVDTATLHDQLTAALTHAGLPAPKVTVRVAANLERHPQTGKLRRFVPLPSQHSRPPR
ncbi:MAG TPA: hypothetical protein VNO83_16990 [Pseudonocardia sp.]|nr:hypothetical protein [Pseudonocardia sp.]